MLPADWMRINTLATVQTLPMIAPVRGRWKCSFDYYYNPWSNIYGYMDNNSRQSVSQIVESCRYVLQNNPGTTQPTFLKLVKLLSKVPKGGVLDFLGFPVGYMGQIEQTRNGDVLSYELKPTYHPAESLITYLDIIRNYYVNNQVSQIPYVALPDGSENAYSYHSLELSALDDFILEARYRSKNTLSYVTSVTELYSSGVTGGMSDYMRYAKGGKRSNLNDFKIYSQSGLFLRNYRMDLLRGIMNADVGSYSAKIDVSGSFVTMDTINFYSKLQKFINRIDITGGRFSDWIQTRWNIDSGIEVDRPIYLGSHSMWLNTIDVIATASGSNDLDANNNKSSLGQQVGYQVGKMATKKQRPITVKSKQYGTLMCIFSIVPDVVYSQGFELNMLKTKFADIYDPAFKQIGFQDVFRHEMMAQPSINSDGVTIHYFASNYPKQPVGKRIAWSEYMASLGRAHGDFAYGQSLDYWVNNRVYTSKDKVLTVGESGDTTTDVVAFRESSLARLFYNFDPSTFVYPAMWNSPFADKSSYAMNYTVDVFFQIDSNRSLGKRVMPHM